jgi:hypothetical protein
LSDDFKIQHSINIPSGEQFEKGDMVNIRANSPEEFASLMRLFGNPSVVQEIAEASANLKAAYLVVREMGGQVVTHAQNPPSAPPAAQQPSQGYPPQQQHSAPQGQFQSPYGAPQAQQPYGGQGQPQGGGYGGQQQPSGYGQPSAPPDQGQAPTCSHGVKKFIEKPYKSGKPGTWKAWACPAGQGDPTQHELEFIDQR